MQNFFFCFWACLPVSFEIIFCCVSGFCILCCLIVVVECRDVLTGLGLARFYTNSPGAEKFRPASLSMANNMLSPVLRPRAMFLKRFVAVLSVCGDTNFQSLMDVCL